ncbi:hypothetical protein E3N88_12829 [Mikania micrantha]|uniref:CCHC-type domain-containing protein n=1 Tax=Mikania micrantha TaxID=192012 RepID=A0A5N6P6S5_9ASTR|nr:hypothetical protein E3N88_12829 [Mikania micrantha]
MTREEKPSSSNVPIREEGNFPLQYPKLTKTNYTTWALMMETILKAYSLWETIEIKGVDEKKVHTTKAMIFQTLPQDVLMQVAQYSTAKEVWDSIKVKYLGADLVQKARLQTLRNKVLVRKLLNSVPNKFLPIVASIEQYQEIDKMSFEEAVGRIVVMILVILQIVQDEPDANYQSKLLMASSNSQGRGRGRGKHFNKGENTYGRGMGRGNKDKNKFRCYNCGDFGHFANSCTKWKNKEKEKPEASNLIYDEEPTLLLEGRALSGGFGTAPEVGCVDSVVGVGVWLLVEVVGVVGFGSVVKSRSDRLGWGVEDGSVGSSGIKGGGFGKIDTQDGSGWDDVCVGGDL